MFPQGMPSLTGGAGGAAGPAAGTSNNGLALPMNTPFNFDSSGWVVNFGTNSGSASGNTGANGAQQTATPTATSSGSGASATMGYGSGGGVVGPGTQAINASRPTSGGGVMIFALAIGAYLILTGKF